MTKCFTKALKSHDRLSARMKFSSKQLERVRRAIKGQNTCARDEICVFVAGSLGRLETGKISDLDVFLLADDPNKKNDQKTLSRLEEIQALSEIIHVNSSLNLPQFSGDGEYFKIHEVRNLLAGTGTAIDDSENLFTTRLLLLLESKCLANERLYRAATTKVFEMYFQDGTGRSEYRPLFLLNDILRYWRTVCLNYERTRREPKKPWHKKNLNLKFSRKLTVFSTVLALLIEHVDNIDKFKTLTEMTPMQRLAYALDRMADQSLLDPFQTFLNNYEEFLAAKSHEELEMVNHSTVDHYRATAQQFDDFLHQVFSSTKLDQKLVRYLLI